MNLKRAIWISILLYITTFISGIVVAITLKTDLSGDAQITTTHWIIVIILSIILATLFSLWHFKGKGRDASPKEGFYLGIMFLVIGMLGDAIFVLSYIFAGIGNVDALASYYSDPLFYVSVILIVLTPVVVGYFKGR